MGLKYYTILIMLCLTGCQAATYPFAHEDGHRKIVHAQERELDLERLVQPPPTPDLYVGVISGLSPHDATKVRHHLQRLLAEGMIPLAVNEMKAAYSLNADCKVEENDQETALVCTWKMAQHDQKEQVDQKEIRHMIETNDPQFALDSLTILQAKEVVPFVRSYVMSSQMLRIEDVRDNKPADEKIAAVITAKTPSKVTIALTDIKGVSMQQKKLLEGFLRTLFLQKKIEWVNNKSSQYQIKGIIKLSPTQGKEKITMAWEVLYQDVSLGTMSQENFIPKGQFAKIWQAQIYPIAQGIVDGVVALIAQQTKSLKE